MAATASIKWPPEFTSEGDLVTVSGPDDTGQAIRFQVMTDYHEIPLTEDGSDLRRNSVFEPNDSVLESLMRDAVKTAVRRSLPDLEFVSSKFSFNKD